MRHLVTLAVSLLFVGYTSAASPTMEEQVLAALEGFHVAERDGNLQGILDSYSEEFQDSQGSSKAMLAGFFDAIVSQGLLKDLVVDMDEMIIRVDGDKATAAPITYTSQLGSNTYAFTLRLEENSNWRFIFSEEL